MVLCQAATIATPFTYAVLYVHVLANCVSVLLICSVQLWVRGHFNSYILIHVCALVQFVFSFLLIHVQCMCGSRSTVVHSFVHSVYAIPVVNRYMYVCINTVHYAYLLFVLTFPYVRVHVYVMYGYMSFCILCVQVC